MNKSKLLAFALALLSIGERMCRGSGYPENSGR